MNRPMTLAALLLSTALLASSATLAVPDPDISELFDPAALRQNICGGDARERGVNRPVQLAAAGPAAAPAAGERPVLRKGLGSLTYPVTTTSRQAQAYFDQGLRFMYAFNYGEAILAFRAAQEIDPACAMCFWGESIALGPNINFEMSNRAHLQALIAIARANKERDGASPRERALIDAAKTRYSADAKATRAQLDTAYAGAMAKVHGDFPDDADIATLFAEAVMDSTNPWWMPGGKVAAGRMPDAVTALEGVLRTHRDHPGAIHYYLHVMEGSARIKAAEPYADRLAALMPAAGHIVHMPSHIYFPLGRYKDALAANLKAIKADEAYFASVATFETNYYSLFSHNLHFGLQSADMAGDAVTALALAAKLTDAISDDLMRAKFSTQRDAAAVLFARLRFDTPDAILALPKPDRDFTYLTAFWHYAQGTAHALKGDVAKAEAEANILAGYRASDDVTVLGYASKTVPRILEVAEYVLRARIKGAAGKWAEAIAPLQQAVAVEDEIGWTGDPPWWDNPLRQSLGIALLRAGKTADAIDALRQALIRAPNDGVVLFALQQASATLGDKTGDREYGKLFKKAWSGTKPPDLDRL